MVEFIVLAILALKPDWQPQACERTFATDGARAACESERDEGAAWVRQLAGYIVTEAERQDLDPLLMVAVAWRESRLESGDVCRRTIEADRIVSREPLGEDGRETLVFQTRADAERTVEWTVTVIEERENGDLFVDKCSAGEMGTFQLINSETRAGTIVPATGQELPRNARERRLVVLDPQTNVSLAAVALAASRDWACEVVDEDDRDICLQDPWSWVGTYNTGARTGTKWFEYTVRVSATYQNARDAACAQMPGNELCPQPELPFSGPAQPDDEGGTAGDQ